jgi:hypothetical protein
MKLEPIRNPHAKIGQVQKKTKVEEKEELIDNTKRATLDKYGVLNPPSYSLEKSSGQEVYAATSSHERPK